MKSDILSVAFQCKLKTDECGCRGARHSVFLGIVFNIFEKVMILTIYCVYKHWKLWKCHEQGLEMTPIRGNCVIWFGTGKHE